jgi:hypothetical protein
MDTATQETRQTSVCSAPDVEVAADHPCGEVQRRRSTYSNDAATVGRLWDGPRNVIAVTITDLEPRGDQVRVRTADFSADVTAAAVADLVPLTPIVFAVKANEVAIYRA